MGSPTDGRLSHDDRLPLSRLQHVHRPGDGTSGSKGNIGSACSATLHPPCSKHIGIAFNGMAASFVRPSRTVTPEPRSGLRCRRKGVDGEDLGRRTIGLAMIGCGHA
jgi:hypothetical protein